MTFTAFLAIISVVLVSVTAFDCNNHQDGTFEIGCKSFVQCVKGVANVVQCPANTVYNAKTKLCDLPQKVDPPCGLIKDCSNLKDGRYADVDRGCHSYYTCLSGAYLGHNFCPGNNVYNTKIGTCDWAFDTAPPCGTKS